MTLHLANPLCWLLIAAALPLLIHLFARMKPKEKEFSSLLFLRKAVLRHSRLKKPVDFLLLLLRSLAFFALAAAFLLPYLSGQFNEEKLRRNVILVVDRSASLAATDGIESRIGKAGKLAENIVNDLRSTDYVNLIWLDAQPEALFRQPSPSKNMVLRELQRIQTHQEEGSPELALRLALAQAELHKENISTELYIISDFQSSNWDNDKLFTLLPENLATQFISVARTPHLDNSAVTDLKILPYAPLHGQSVTIQAELSNFSKTPLRATAHLEAGPIRSSQVCEIPAGGKTTVYFPMTAPDSGTEWMATVSLDNDSFPSDDSRSVITPLKKTLRADVVVADPTRMGYMLKALDSLPFLYVQTAAGIGTNNPEFIIWHQPTALDVEQIHALAQAGAVILVIPDFSGDNAVNSLMGAESPSRAQSEYASDTKGWSMKIAAPDDSSFSLFDKEQRDQIFRGNIFQRLHDGLGDNWPSSVTVLAEYEDKVPAIARKDFGKGAIILWNTPILQRDSTWGISPHFLPYLGELLLNSRRDGELPKDIQPGRDLLEWKVPSELNAADIVLHSPEGTELPLNSRNTPDASTRLTSIDKAVPGIYEWINIRENNHVVHRNIVSFPVAESPLISLDKESTSTSRLSLVTEQEGEEILTSRRYQLWPWLIFITLIALLAELLICSRLSRKRSSTMDEEKDVSHSSRASRS